MNSTDKIRIEWIHRDHGETPPPGFPGRDGKPINIDVDPTTPGGKVLAEAIANYLRNLN